MGVQHYPAAKKVPDQFRGRVLSTEMMILTFVLSVSTYLTGVAIDQGVDPRVVMLRLGAVFMLPGSLWIGYLVWLKRRN